MFCALLFALFGKGCNLYRSNFEILQILSLPFRMQNKLAFTPEVCCKIIWAIIVNTRFFFDDIKLADDFLEQGQYIQFLVSTLEGDYMAIKYGIKIECHNFPQEWQMPEPYHERLGGYQQGKGGGGDYHPQFLPDALVGLTSPWTQPNLSMQPTQPYNWQPAMCVDECHPKIRTMIEPLLTKIWGPVLGVQYSHGRW
jgi:hypothetical protein